VKAQSKAPSEGSVRRQLEDHDSQDFRSKSDMFAVQTIV
jgi:hypothetical protein